MATSQCMSRDVEVASCSFSTSAVKLSVNLIWDIFKRGGDSGLNSPLFLKLIESYSAVPRSRSPMLWLMDTLSNALI